MPEEDVSSPKGLIIGSTILALAVGGAGYLFLSDTDKGAVQRTVEPAATGQIAAVAPLPEAARLPPSHTSNAAEPSPQDSIRTATPAQAPAEDAASSSRGARPVDAPREAEVAPERPPTAQPSSREPILTESAAQSASPTLPPPQTRPSEPVPQVAPPQASVPLQPAATVPQKPDVLFVQRSAVNIRSAPSRTSGVVGTAALGTRFEATNRENTWVQVESGPLKGWINGALLAANEPQQPKTLRVQRSATGTAPTVNIKATCQTAQKTITEIFGDDVAITFDGCMRQEQDAADQLARNWGTYPTEDRQRCVNKTGYMPSYVEWLTCFEMARDVRQMRKDQPATPKATTRNKTQKTSKKS